MNADSTLTHRRIFRFYSPLALSWLFMAVEGPVCMAVISRLRDAEVNTAAFNILMGLAIFIESPVIDLLTTSTTLSKTRRDYAEISKFVWLLIAGVTLVHILVVLTPLYWVVTLDLMHVPKPVAEAARLGLAIMVPWSGFIGWRRYLQGILIRFHRTRLVGWGTGIRVGTIVATCLTLFNLTSWPGVQIAALALVLSVGAEAMFAHVVTRRAIAENLSMNAQVQEPGESSSERLTLRRLAVFHAPLTLTTMVTLMGGPIVSSFLARAHDPVLTLAAWQVAASFIWLFRTVVFALPEAVITLYKDEATARVLRNFCLFVGSSCTFLILGLGLARVDVAFFRNVYGHSVETSELAHLAFLASAPLPAINAAQSYVRGLLTAHHLNVARFGAVAVATATLVGALMLGMLTPWRGVLAASLALIFALLAEQAVLMIAWRRRGNSGDLWPGKRSVYPS